MTDARIKFANLEGFPAGDHDKIQTELFLTASNEIVDVFRSFGTLFTPVINDMSGNITKIRKSYQKDPIQYEYLEDLIILNVNIDSFAGDALLWLKRALQLICTFFENILKDEENTEIVTQHLQDAYEKTLEPYHGFFVRSTIKLIYNWLPTRSQLIGHGIQHDENIKVLESFLPSMRRHLDRIDNLMKKYDLDKV